MYIYSVGYACYDCSPTWRYQSATKYSQEEFVKICKECAIEVAEDLIKDIIIEHRQEFIEYMCSDCWEPTITREKYEEAIDSYYNINWYTHYILESEQYDQALLKRGLTPFEVQAGYTFSDEDLTRVSKPTKRNRITRDYDFFVELGKIYEDFYEKNPEPKWELDESSFVIKIVD